MRTTKVGLEVRLRRKVQLLPQPAELLFPGLLGNAVVDSSFSGAASPAPETRAHSNLSSESWKVKYPL